MKPYKCPVCNGKGIVPTGFYNSLSGYYISSTTVSEKCRSCNGTGIIWGWYEDEHVWGGYEDGHE